MFARATRHSAHYQVQFAYPDYAGEGVTLDLSDSGLCMITTCEIPTGVQLYLRVLLPDSRWIEFQTARVRWCQGGKIGLEVLRSDEDQGQPCFELLSHSAQKGSVPYSGGTTVHVPGLGAAQQSEAAEA
jgi:PilZ domain-containing protein